MRSLACRWVVFVLCLLPMTASAATGTLVLAFAPLPPWRVVEADGRLSGPYYDIAVEFARRLSLPLEVRVCPVKRCMALLETGEADLVLGVTPTPERRTIIEFLDPPYAPPAVMSFFVNREETRPLRHYGDLRGWHIGVVDGRNYFARFDEDRQLAKDMAPDSLSNMLKLAARRIDTAVFNRSEAWWLIRRNHLESRIVESPYRVVLNEPRYFGLSRKSRFQGQKAQLKAILRAMVNEGVPKRLLAPIESPSR